MVGPGRGGGSAAGARNTMVTIVINTTLKDLASLNKQTMDTDINSSWKDAIFARFNMNLDPKKFSIRKKDASAPKHNISEPIRIWVCEFKKIRQKYIVSIMENAVKRGSTGTQQQQQEQASTSSSTTPSMPTTLPRGSSSKKKATPKVKFPRKKKSVKREPSPVPSTISQSTVELRSPTRSAAGGSRKRSQVTDTGGADPSTSRRPRFEEDANNGDNETSEDEDTNNNRNNNRQNGIGNRGWQPQPQVDLMDDDNMSQCSQDSQDSQDDLVDLGIPFVDFKSKLIKNVMEKYSNSQYLKAQHYTRELKDKNQKQWTKWKMGNPTIAMMVLDLFEI